MVELFMLVKSYMFVNYNVVLSIQSSGMKMPESKQKEICKVFVKLWMRLMAKNSEYTIKDLISISGHFINVIKDTILSYGM